MKRKIQFKQKALSSEEIAKHEDFDAVLNQYSKTKSPVYKKGWFRMGIAAMVVVAGYLILQPTEKSAQVENLAVVERFVNPPMAALDIAYEEHTLKSGESGVIERANGTKIEIPANAFVDAEGKDVQGEVTIKYREFHDQLEIMLSGIPMEYDSGGTSYQFESAGMMEIQGFKDGEPIFIKEGKSLDVALASYNEGEEFNLYYLDTVQENWTNIGKDSIVERVAMNSDSTSNSDDVPWQDLGPDEQIDVAQIEPIQSEASLLSEISEKPTKPIKPKERNELNYVFEVDILPEEFPELAGYNGAMFEVIEEKSDFKESFYDVEWTNLDLKRAEGKEGEYKMVISRGKRSHVLYVYPVFEGKDYQKALKEFDKKYSVYKKELAAKTKREEERRKEHEAYIAKRKAERKKDSLEYVAYKEKMREVIRRDSIKQEKEMLAYQTGAISATPASFTRNFQIKGFGIYNCDRPFVPTERPVNAQFVLNNNDPFDGVVSMLDQSINSVYNIGRCKNEIRSIRLNTTQPNVLVAFLGDDKVGYSKADLKEVVRRDDVYVCEFEVLENIKTIADLRKQIDI